MIWKREDHAAETVIQRGADLTNMAPDALRDSVRNALSALTADELDYWRDQLLSGLREAGLNLGAYRFLIGISVDSIGTLTPSDIAHLIRYVRINMPEALKIVAGRLGKLLIDTNGPVKKASQSRRAA